jgi:hypothetical protein
MPKSKSPASGKVQAIKGILKIPKFAVLILNKRGDIAEHWFSKDLESAKGEARCFNPYGSDEFSAHPVRLIGTVHYQIAK